MGRVNGAEQVAFKKIAIDILRERGFMPWEIHEEYEVGYRLNGQVRYKVDVAGIKGDYKVAIECGKTRASKLLDLRKIFDEVIVIDVSKVVEMYEHLKTKYFNDVNKLKNENRRLLERAKWVCEDANKRVGELQEEIDRLKREVSSLKAKLRKYQKVMAEAWEAVKEQS